jgi:hypothetical protein
MGNGTCPKFYHPAVERSVIYGKMPRFSALSRTAFARFITAFRNPAVRAATVESGRNIQTL